MGHRFELGDEVEDNITGFRGVIFGRHEWLHGCTTYTLQPRGLNKDGQPFERKSFDEPQLRLVAKQLARPSSRNTGGPRDAEGAPVTP